MSVPPPLTFLTDVFVISSDLITGKSIPVLVGIARLPIDRFLAGVVLSMGAAAGTVFSHYTSRLSRGLHPLSQANRFVQLFFALFLSFLQPAISQGTCSPGTAGAPCTDCTAGRRSAMSSPMIAIVAKSSTRVNPGVSYRRVMPPPAGGGKQPPAAAAAGKRPLVQQILTPPPPTASGRYCRWCRSR